VLPVPAASHPIRHSSPQPRRLPRAAVLSKVTHSVLVASPIGILQRRACKCIACAMCVLVAFRIASVPWPPQQHAPCGHAALRGRIASHRIAYGTCASGNPTLDWRPAPIESIARYTACRYVRKQRSWLRHRLLGHPCCPPVYRLDSTDAREWVSLVRTPAVRCVQVRRPIYSFVRSGAARSVPLRVAPPHAPHRIALCERDSMPSALSVWFGPVEERRSLRSDCSQLRLTAHSSSSSSAAGAVE
jgi:hypothetical protein